MQPKLPDWLQQSVAESRGPTISVSVTHSPEYSVVKATHSNNEKRDKARKLVKRTLPTYLPEHLLNILDLGCGNALIHPRAVRIDVHNGLWRWADGSKEETLAQLIWDVRTLPFIDEIIDAIFSWHLLEHFWDDERVAMLKDWTRVLRIGGRMCLVYPEFPYAGGIDEEPRRDSWGHKSELTEAKVLADFAQIANLRVLERGWSTIEWDKYIIAEKVG